MQDAEGAKLRDELRGQAQLWDEHGRSEDYLWTGTAFREFELWRERYPGGLTSVEEEFAGAMTHHAERRRRRRRIAVAATFVVLLAVLATVGGFWRQSEVAKTEAIAEARRAEAAKLLAIGQLKLETDPTEGLAFVASSLELADTEEARLTVLRLISEAPPALVQQSVPKGSREAVFSPDGSRLAVAGHSDEVAVFAEEGPPPLILPGHGSTGAYRTHASLGF